MHFHMHMGQPPAKDKKPEEEKKAPKDESKQDYKKSIDTYTKDGTYNCAKNTICGLMGGVK